MSSLDSGDHVLRRLQPTRRAAPRRLRAARARAGTVLRGLSRAVRAVPRAAWTCALIATVSAACWSLITPPFQAPDEPSHFAYVVYLAETGKLPQSASSTFSPAEEAVLTALNQSGVEWHPEVGTISSPLAQLRLREDLELPLSRSSQGGASVAASEPPLYYALEAVPYELGSAGTLLDQLELMRLLSALMAGVTVLFAFLFVRETLPAVRWAWTVGGLGVAFMPLLGFTSGAVTPDAMLYAVTAAVFYCLARAFRRGLTVRLAIAAGTCTAVGFLTKLNFIGLAPGVMLGFLILGLRGVHDPARPERSSPRAFGAMAIAIGIAVTPIVVYALSNLLANHHLLGIVSSSAHGVGKRTSIFSSLSYIWQFYLPRLPGMSDYFPGISVTRDIWFDRAVGCTGGSTRGFPIWVTNLALIPAVLIAALCARAFASSRGRLRARASELACYAVMSLGLLALIAEDSHLHDQTEGGWAQPRYLLPLAPLAAAALALAARGAGRRAGPIAGVLIVGVGRGGRRLQPAAGRGTLLLLSSEAPSACRTSGAPAVRRTDACSWSAPSCSCAALSRVAAPSSGPLWQKRLGKAILGTASSTGVGGCMSGLAALAAAVLNVPADSVVPSRFDAVRA